MGKKVKRLRRATKTRAKIKELQMPRLCVHRTPRHIYVQVIMPDGSVIVSASTVEKEVRELVTFGGNIAAAKVVGKIVAEKCKAAKVDTVAFDRSGFKYHGRVRALAEAAREYGLLF